MKKIVYFEIIVSIVFCACKQPEQFSVIPEIKFISFGKYQDDKIEDGAMLTFSFQDGDGDIGLNGTDLYPPFDTLSIYYYNFFCDYYEKQNGIFVKIDSIETPKEGMQPFNLNARFPRLSDLPEESIHGEICLTMPFYYDTTSPYNDTIQFKFFIIDRKLNHSNIEEIIVVR